MSGVVPEQTLFATARFPHRVQIPHEPAGPILYPWGKTALEGCRETQFEYLTGLLEETYSSSPEDIAAERRGLPRLGSGRQCPCRQETRPAASL